MSDKTDTKQKKNPPNQFQPGESGNPAGRPKGSLNFATKWKRFIEKVAEDNGLSPAEIDEQLYKVAWQKAKEGDYQFYRDIQDRVHGKPQQSVDHTTGGKELPTPILDYVQNHNSDKAGDGNGSADSCSAGRNLSK